jgi:uncharacterized membrane protein YqgA involved in biofilm formation
MPYGSIINILALIVGGLFGAPLGKKISEQLKTAMNNVFGLCAMAIGIILIIRLNALAPVVMSIIVGSMIGELLRIEDRVNGFVKVAAPKLLGGKQVDEDFIITFCSVAVLFCFSGTGWYGVISESLTGDGSILYAKSILDVFTAVIFAAVLGKIVAYLAVPQLVVYAVLFGVAKLIGHLVTPTMIGDFSAIGGMIVFATGLRMTGIKREFRIINMLPGMILIFPLSALWTALMG